jgi:hypothetical protein
MATAPSLTFLALDTKDLLILLQELGASLRARSEPEHLYTAAAFGSFGAVAWGVAALNPHDYLSRPILTRPATVAALGIFFVASSVITKIRREHNKFTEIKKQYSMIAARLKALPNGDDVIPSNWIEPAGEGHHYSEWVVILAAGAAIAFCLSLVGWQL